MKNPFPSTEMVTRDRGIIPWARLSTNENEFGLADEVISAICVGAGAANRYPDCEHFELREELGKLLEIHRNNLLVSTGIDGLIHLACRTYARGQTVIVTEGTYPTFRYFADIVGADIQTVPYRDFRIDVAGLVQKAVAHRASIIYLAEPDNPTGSAVGREALAELIRGLPNGCLLLVDGAYVEFQGSGERLSVADFLDQNVIWLRTFSKAYGLAGLRIGYAIGKELLLEPMNNVAEHYSVSRTAQEAAIAALNARAFLTKVVSEVDLGRAHYETTLSALNVSTLPSQTNFVAAIEDGAVSLEEVSKFLAAAGIFSRYLRIGHTGLLRLTIGPQRQREQVLSRLLEIFGTVKI